MTLYGRGLFIDFRYKLVIGGYGFSFTVIEYSIIAGFKCEGRPRHVFPCPYSAYAKITGTVRTPLIIG